MMIFEQLQEMNEKLAKLGVGDSSSPKSADKGKHPSQTTNPHGEVKSLHTLRSGTQYIGPSMPVEMNQQAEESSVRQ